MPRVSKKSTETSVVPPATPIDAFVYKAIKNPLTEMVFAAVCECKQIIFSVTGLGLQVEIPEGMDLTATCRCGRQYGVAEQAKRSQDTNTQ